MNNLINGNGKSYIKVITNVTVLITNIITVMKECLLTINKF